MGIPHFSWRIDGGGAALVRCEAASGDVCVPDTALGLPVTSVDGGAFRGLSELTGVALPHTVWRIGDNAFLGCRRLRHVRLPECLQALGSGAFEGCEALESVELPKGLAEIPDRAFYLCGALRGIDVPAGVTSLGENAFAGCAGLSWAALPEGLVRVGPRAFAGCGSLNALRIPRSVERIDASSLPAHLHTRGSLYLPGSGLLIRAEARLHWSAPTGTRILADGALAGNHDLTGVDLPETVVRVGDRAFDDCRCLHAVRLPEGLRHLGVSAFRGCSGLRSVQLPGGLTSISGGLFENSGLTETRLPETIERVEDRAFAGCAQLESVTLNAGITRLGHNAFARCDRLKRLTLPARLSALGPRVLADCKSLETLVIPGPLPEGLSQALAGLNRVAVVTPRLGPDALPPLWRKRGCLGFARAAAMGISYSLDSERAWIEWMRAHAAALAGDAATDGHLLHRMLEHRCLNDADARRLVDRVSREEQPELTLELLSYLRDADTSDAESLW